MAYIYDIRLTPKFFCEPDGDELSDHIRLQILKYLKPSRYLIAEERLDSKGRETHLHYHINCELDRPIRKDTIQKWFRDKGICKGNQAYCVRSHGDLNDEDRWWRYCCKEKLRWSRGFDAITLDNYSLLAKDERKQQIERNLATEKSMEAKNQKRDKLFKWLKEERPDVKDERSIFVAMVFWYQKVAKDTPPIANGCLLNKVFDYQMEIGVLTAGEYYDRHYS